MLKKLLICFTIIFALICFAALNLVCFTVNNAFAAERYSYSVQLKGETLDSCAFSEEGTMYLPLRSISEAFGYTVEWSAKDRSVTLENASGNIVIRFDAVTLNEGKRKIIDGKAYLSADDAYDSLGIVFAQSRTEKMIFLRSVKEKEQTIKTGEIYSVILKGNPTAGYLWQYKIEDDSVIKLDTESSVPDSALTGAGSTFTWNFKALKPGKTKITLQYYRSWEGEESALQTEEYYINVEK